MMSGEITNGGAGKEVVSIQNLWAGYDDEVVLEDINLSVKALDYIGLIGPNGGGKTTLLKVLLGLIQPYQGEVRIMGKSVLEGRQHIGYVPQSVEFDRSFPIRVFDVVQMGRLGKKKLLHRFTKEDDQAVLEALENVDLMDQKDHPIGELSGGQRQRVFIARALASQPSILLLDEPMASVDPHVSINIFELLREINKTMTIILISHNMDAISSYVKTIGCVSRKLFYHAEKAITAEMLEDAYQCPIDLIAHGMPHRHLYEHSSGEAKS